MRVFIAVIVLIFSLQSWTKADDISDFEIEGVSVGDSLLDYIPKNKIESIKSASQYPNDKFIIYILDTIIDLDKFDFLSVTTKKNDNKYIITSVSAGIDYKELKNCIELKSQIKIAIENTFNENDKEDTEYKAAQDKTGKSIVYGTQYYLKPYPSVESITVNCKHMSKESGIDRALKLIVASESYANFVINDAYK